MTPVVKWLRDLKERWVGSFYEGPEPPLRLAEIVVAFANAHPKATRGEWIAFAAAHAGEAYRSGYVRGHEWAERDDEMRPDVPPEVVADLVDPDWRWRRAILIDGSLVEVVPDGWPEEQLMREQMERVNRGGRR